MHVKSPDTDPFDSHTDRYDTWFEHHPAIYESELNAIRQLLPPGFESGLEVGVGTGRFAAPLGIATGLEPSIKMGAVAPEAGELMW